MSPRGATTTRASALAPVDGLKAVLRRAVLRRLERISAGRLEIVEGSTRLELGMAAGDALAGRIVVEDPAFWESVAWGGSIGAGEAYCEGLWSTPDLTSVIRVLARNREALDEMEGGLARLASPLRRWWHARRSNSRAGSRRNIRAHYDAGNDLFSLFLDKSLTYSCAIFPDPDSSLETAQRWKLDTICRKLELQPGDRVLEIGTGWGGLALHAAREYGCEIVTTTISRRQFEYAAEAVRRSGLADRVTVLRKDYRDLAEHSWEPFDKVVSIEMIEAVGHSYLPRYFEGISRSLRPGGLALLQAILIPDQRYDRYRRSVDFIQRYVFPGGLLPSLARICETTSRHTDLGLISLDDLTPHYARTLAAWARRFEANESKIAALGLSRSDRRLWKYYFGYCEGAFRERAVTAAQLLFTQPERPTDAR